MDKCVICINIIDGVTFSGLCKACWLKNQNDPYWKLSRKIMIQRKQLEILIDKIKTMDKEGELTLKKANSLMNEINVDAERLKTMI